MGNALNKLIFTPYGTHAQRRLPSKWSQYEHAYFSIALMPGAQMNADEIAKALNGQRAGSGWSARCPVHDDRTPSLSIKTGDDGKVLVHCFAGCGQNEVVSQLKARGLWPLSSNQPSRPIERAADNTDPETRTKRAMKTWNLSGPPEGTAVERYLHGRGLKLPMTPTPPMPLALRNHQGLKHPTGSVWPAMVALVTNGLDGAPMAIHRTFLLVDGSGKAPVDPAKMMYGPTRGGAVRLGEAGEKLLIGEGIETCLAAMQATSIPAWAALSASGFSTLALPPEVREVIILADGDEAGVNAARDAARRWKWEGRITRVAQAPEGEDFNDILLRGLVQAEGESSW